MAVDSGIEIWITRMQMCIIMYIVVENCFLSVVKEITNRGQALAHLKEI